MTINPNSLANLDKGREARAKDAKRCNFTLRPETVEALKKLPNMSDALDKMVAYVRSQGLANEIFFGNTHDRNNQPNPTVEDTHDTIEDSKAQLKDTHDRNNQPNPIVEDTHDTIEDLKAQLKDTHDRILNLESELAEARSLRLVESTQLSSQTAPQLSEILELPEAATLLNQLKAKRKKSKTDLQDVEAILELLPEMPAQPQAQLPDLYAARDKLFQMPSLGGWKFEKGEKSQRFYAFAEALIEEAAKLNPNYTLIDRLKSDLKQATERCEGYGNQLSEKLEIIHKQEVKLGQRKF